MFIETENGYVNERYVRQVHQQPDDETAVLELDNGDRVYIPYFDPEMLLAVVPAAPGEIAYAIDLDERKDPIEVSVRPVQIVAWRVDGGNFVKPVFSEETGRFVMFRDPANRGCDLDFEIYERINGRPFKLVRQPGKRGE